MQSKELKQALTSDSGMMYLLQNYGQWARYTGVRGLAVTDRNTSYTIQDDTALIIDRALAQLKVERPAAYKLLKLHYIRGMSASEINKIMKAGHFTHDPELSKHCKYLQVYIVSDLIREAEKILTEKIKAII